MQAWVVPGAPFRDGWRLWYATAGKVPQRVRITCRGQAVSFDQHCSAPVRLPGFPHVIFHVRLRLHAPLPANDLCQIHIPETGEQHSWQLLPAAVPAEGCSFFFGSCFWQDADKGALRRAFLDLMSIESPPPLFKLLLGDQVYLDWPADVAPWTLARGGEALVSRRYLRYWGDADYRGFLGTLPNVVVADDHEYWNNYPETQVQLPVTWHKGLREAFARAAVEYYRQFQGELNGSDPAVPARSWTVIDLPPASLFVADTRSERTHHNADPAHLMGAEQWQALESWQRSLKGPGLLALGQPLFQKDGDFRDYSLSNFVDDYRRLLAVIQASAAGDNDERVPHNIVILTGDIHSARSTQAIITELCRNDPGNEFARVHELVASANSTLVMPFSTRAPQAERPPATLPPGKSDQHFTMPWTVQPVNVTAPRDVVRDGAAYASVDNNIGVVRLLPSAIAPYALELTYASWRIRPHHLPAWRARADKGPDRGGARLIYSQTLHLR